MYCKYCGKQMEEDAKFCPACGKSQQDVESVGPEIRKQKMPAKNLIMILVAAVVCVALVACIVIIGLQGNGSGGGATLPSVPATIPTDGDPNNETAKGTYTLEDKDQLLSKMNDVVATMGENKLTNAQLQVYYWMGFFEFMEEYSYMASYIGLDFNKPLDSQSCQFTKGTWQQYFLSSALESWKRYRTMAEVAEKNNFKLESHYQEYLDNLEKSLAETAKENEYDNYMDLLYADMGPGVTIEAYRSYLTDYYNGYLYFTQEFNKLTATDAEIEKYFTDNEDALKEEGITKDKGYVVNVRHILLEPKGDTADATKFTEAQWEACRKEAQAVLDQWLAGEKTEESFASLAKEHSTDPGSKNQGGLYTDVTQGEMVEEFDAWIFHKDRKVGDYGLVKTEYGYHIMFFSGTSPEWYVTCRNAVLTEKSEKALEDIMKDVKLEVSYKDIYLGLADLTAGK